MKFEGMIIGVPTEIMHGEGRVSSTPETVKKMVAEGATVLVQKGAGNKSFFSDEQYVAAGATIIDRADEIFAKADVILKVKEPLFNEEVGKHESEMLRDGQYLITFLHPAAPVNREPMKKLRDTGCISITLDGIPRITRAQTMDALTSMSTVAGYKGMLMAASYMTKFVPMVGTAVGVLKPANVVVIGTGVAGLQAVATAKRLGAVVTAIDIRPAAAEQARSLGAKTLETGVPAELAIGQGGYALRLPDEWLAKEIEAIRETIVAADVVICSALIPGELAPVIVTEDMVKSMAAGSVIVDIAIDQGGNCALTKAGEEFRTENGVLVSGVKNIPGMMPTASTWMFAQNIYNLLAYLAQD
ncbi:MAG: NAD(P) transhydrogenase subunit alpha, partial [Mailhella sp.]|nr:NAD(P) transhydrogenase subunit alpha [Mailhella sp.]